MMKHEDWNQNPWEQFGLFGSWLMADGLRPKGDPFPLMFTQKPVGPALGSAVIDVTGNSESNYNLIYKSLFAKYPRQLASMVVYQIIKFCA